MNSSKIIEQLTGDAVQVDVGIFTTPYWDGLRGSDGNVYEPIYQGIDAREAMLWARQIISTGRADADCFDSLNDFIHDLPPDIKSLPIFVKIDKIQSRFGEEDEDGEEEDGEELANKISSKLNKVLGGQSTLVRVVKK